MKQGKCLFCGIEVDNTEKDNWTFSVKGKKIRGCICKNCLESNFAELALEKLLEQK